MAFGGPPLRPSGRGGGHFGFAGGIAMTRFWRVGKRGSDVGLALVGAWGLAPAGLLAALLIRLTSPGPVLLRQWRQGRLGRPFALLKFRSMTADGQWVDRKSTRLNSSHSSI